MKKTLAIAAVLMSLASPVAAQTTRSVCGQGYITALGVNASTLDAGVTNKRNIYIRVEKMEEKGFKYGKVDGQVAIVMNYRDEGMFTSQLDALRTAFVAGVPVLIMGEGKICFNVDSAFNVTMCTASAVSGHCQV